MIYIKLIKSFINTRLFIYICIALITLFVIVKAYNNVYNKGYLKAKEEAKEELLIELEKQKKVTEIHVQKAQVVFNNEERIKTIYKDKIITIEKIVEKPIYKECKMENEDFLMYKKIMEEIK